MKLVLWPRIYDAKQIRRGKAIWILSIPIGIFIKSWGSLFVRMKAPWNTFAPSLSSSINEMRSSWDKLHNLWKRNNVLEILRTYMDDFFVINKFERRGIQMHSKTCSWSIGSFTNSKDYQYKAKMAEDHLSHSQKPAVSIWHFRREAKDI